MKAEVTVEAAEGGERLDSYLARKLPQFSRARIQALIESGDILLNQQPTKSRTRLRLGDVINLEEPAPVSTGTEPEDIPLDILYEDADLIVVNKPAGLVVHPGAGNTSGTLVNALLHHRGDVLSGIGGELRPGIVHRLDKETSGALVIAKNDQAHRCLARQFAERENRKIYLAVVHGVPAPASGEIRFGIKRHPVHRKKMVATSDGTGRTAHTSYEVLEISQDRGLSLVQCRLHTGRTHQIRVHLKEIGHPIVGDRVYGKGGSAADSTRHLLHAWRLGFAHPVNAQWLEVTAPAPAEFSFAYGASGASWALPA